MTERKLRVFLCHASQDKPLVRDLYRRLGAEPWVEPWLDEERLLPGQDWDLEIEKAVEASDVVIVCLSARSVTKEGYVQKELRKVLDVALEKPEETIFIIPLRLEECELPRRLRSWHYVDYFPAGQQNRAYQRLLQSLNIRYAQLEPSVREREVQSNTSAKISTAKTPTNPNIFNPVKASSLLKLNTGGEVAIGASILLIVYFALAALDAFMSSSDTIETMLAIAAILAGIALLRRRKIPTSPVFKVSLIIYLLIYGLGYRLTDTVPVALYVAGAAASLAGIMLAVSVRMPGKNVLYSAISLASFLFLVGAYELATNVGYSAFTSIVDTLILFTSMITSVLLWMDV
jgi:hypothetical protein